MCASGSNQPNTNRAQLDPRERERVSNGTLLFDGRRFEKSRNGQPRVRLCFKWSEGSQRVQCDLNIKRRSRIAKVQSSLLCQVRRKHQWHDYREAAKGKKNVTLHDNCHRDFQCEASLHDLRNGIIVKDICTPNSSKLRNHCRNGNISKKTE